MREIVLDTETTGLDPKYGDKLIEIGCIELVNKKLTGNYYHCYINPERDVPKSAQKVHGISTEFLLDKPRFDDIVEDFLSFIRHDKLVIHNAAFDLGFLNFQLNAIARPVINFSRAIDTVKLARNKFPGSKASLDALCNRFGISLEKRVKHGALLDSELLAEVYIYLTGGYQNSFQFDKFSSPINIAGNISENEDKIAKLHQSKNYKKRKFKLSEEELNAHEEFIKKLFKGHN